MSFHDEWLELNNRYHAQREQIEYLKSEVLLLSKQEERMTHLETLLKDFSDFADRIPHAFLSPEMQQQREALQERVGEVLEGRELQEESHE